MDVLFPTTVVQSCLLWTHISISVLLGAGGCVLLSCEKEFEVVKIMWLLGRSWVKLERLGSGLRI